MEERGSSGRNGNGVWTKKVILFSDGGYMRIAHFWLAKPMWIDE
jgi:hypothetical protein